MVCQVSNSGVMSKGKNDCHSAIVTLKIPLCFQQRFHINFSTMAHAAQATLYFPALPLPGDIWTPLSLRA
jgi:hypothetical protein